jgi:hypothetical protein
MVIQLCCGSWEITHANFIADRPNGRGGATSITRNLVGSAFHTTEKIPLSHLLLTRWWQKSQLLVSLLGRPRYRSNRRWKYNTVAYIATAVKVVIVIYQSIVVRPGFSCDGANATALPLPHLTLAHQW